MKRKSNRTVAAALGSALLCIAPAQIYGDTTLTGDYWITEKLGIKTTAQDVGNLGARLEAATTSPCRKLTMQQPIWKSLR